MAIYLMVFTGVSFIAIAYQVYCHCSHHKPKGQ